MNPQQNNLEQGAPQVIMPNQGSGNQPAPQVIMPNQYNQTVAQTTGANNNGQFAFSQPTNNYSAPNQPNVSPSMVSSQATAFQQQTYQQAGEGVVANQQAVSQQANGGEVVPSQQPSAQQVSNGVDSVGQPTPNQEASTTGAKAINVNRVEPVPPVKESPFSTQSTLLISELRDNVVIMKDGSFRAVVACKSINFDLMSEMEREGVEYTYQNFLNSLKFTIQILVRSQKVDIGPYIERLSEIRRNNDNMLLGVLMDDYINFIDVLSQEANIMDKSFFIIIPYYSSPDAEKVLNQTKNFFKSFSKNKGVEVTKIDHATYDKALTELTNRVDAVMSGLFQIGVRSVRLNTKELAELYYNFNNPDTAIREPLVDFSKLATMYVRKGERE